MNVLTGVGIKSTIDNMVRLGDQKKWQENNLEHLRYEYDIRKEEVVLDIGAYDGAFSKEMMQRYDCHVIAFEPTDAIDNNSTLSDLHRRHIWIEKKAAWIDHAGIEMGGEHNWVSPYFFDHRKRYESLDLAAYVRQQMAISTIALCKINIEGGEYELLKHLAREDALRHMRHLQVQFHMIDGHDYEAEYREVAGLLGKTHQIQWRYPFVWESWVLSKPELF